MTQGACAFAPAPQPGGAGAVAWKVAAVCASARGTAGRAPRLLPWLLVGVFVACCCSALACCYGYYLRVLLPWHGAQQRQAVAVAVAACRSEMEARPLTTLAVSLSHSGQEQLEGMALAVGALVDWRRAEAGLQSARESVQQQLGRAASNVQDQLLHVSGSVRHVAGSVQDQLLHVSGSVQDHLAILAATMSTASSSCWQTLDPHLGSVRSLADLAANSARSVAARGTDRAHRLVDLTATSMQSAADLTAKCVRSRWHQARLALEAIDESTRALAQSAAAYSLGCWQRLEEMAVALGARIGLYRDYSPSLQEPPAPQQFE
jgi:alkylhydroperoxidase/carboxymuconolactone decarboxylase family protein YurZ